MTTMNILPFSQRAGRPQGSPPRPSSTPAPTETSGLSSQKSHAQGRLRMLAAHPPRRIAIIRALQLGDLLVAIPAIRVLRRQYPQAEITLIGLPWAASFAQRYRQYIDRFVEFVGYPGIQEVEVNAERTAHFIEEQRAYSYDLVVQMHGSGTASNPLALALGGKVTAGYYSGDPPADLTLGAIYPEHGHEIYRNLGLAALLLQYPQTDRRERENRIAPPASTDANNSHRMLPNTLRDFVLGCQQLDAHLEFPLYKEDLVEAMRLLRCLPGNERPWIGIHPGARSPARRWPVEYFAAVGDELARRFGAQILLTGGPGEEETVQAVAERMSRGANPYSDQQRTSCYRSSVGRKGSIHCALPLNVGGKTSLGGLAALISKLDLFISNDTGPAHLACAVDTPSITLFGPADYERWAPLDWTRHRTARHPVVCSPCGFWDCPIDHRCLRWLHPESVISLAQQLLQKRGGWTGRSRSS